MSYQIFSPTDAYRVGATMFGAACDNNVVGWIGLDGFTWLLLVEL